jgi:hypothetical protein
MMVEMNSKSQFLFRAEELTLLTNVLNEVLNGFEIPEFEMRIEMSKKDLDNVFKRLHALADGEQVVLGLDQTRALRNALLEVIRELGSEEFQTRTGFSFSEGNSILKKLNRLLEKKDI